MLKLLLYIHAALTNTSKVLRTLVPLRAMTGLDRQPRKWSKTALQKMSMFDSPYLSQYRESCVEEASDTYLHLPRNTVFGGAYTSSPLKLKLQAILDFTR